MSANHALVQEIDETQEDQDRQNHLGLVGVIRFEPVTQRW